MNRKNYCGNKYRPYLSKRKKNKGNILALRKDNVPKKVSLFDFVIFCEFSILVYYFLELY